MMPDTMGIEAEKGDIVFFPSHMIRSFSINQIISDYSVEILQLKI